MNEEGGQRYAWRAHAVAGGRELGHLFSEVVAGRWARGGVNTRTSGPHCHSSARVTSHLG